MKSFCIIVLTMTITGGFAALKQIGVIGVGNMANAILNGIKKDKTYNIWIYDIDPAKTAAAAEDLVHIAASIPQLA